MRFAKSFRILGALAVGALMVCPSPITEAAEPAGAGDQAAEIVRLKEEIERLKGMVPDQSHVMKDVAYHFSNLWFAGQAKNWPLAAFYLSETRSHLRWAVRVRPVRQTKAGQVDLATILDGIDRSWLTNLQKTIDARDLPAFSNAYRDTLSGCYACHQASEKPYLRPHVPDAPEGRMIDFSPGGSGQ
ncbi:MAG TPA: hypothetical protein VEG84_01795 [Thermoanaerobaculia bacterium]|nr:hypothetical protein [Thermoanaerobaculia bacterium]